MAKKDMTLRMVLKLASNQFTAGLSSIQKQLSSVGNYLKTAFAVGSVVSFGKEIVKWSKDFEDSMARVKAVSNASSEGFKMMRDEALRLGASTRYTSVEVANTLEVLTRNGLSAANSTRVLADVLKLAQANAVELADAGNMVTNTLNMFGLGVQKAGYVTDILSATAANSATDLTNLYDAMVNAAPMAHALGINIEETASALGALANVGVKGADAGTQLRQFFQRLTDPTAMKKMQKMTGFAFTESFIDTEGLEGVLKKLQSLNLSVSELNEIFTVRSSKSIIQLQNSMADFIRLLGVMENSSGTASRMFVEGVGNMRYELDVLKSMWQNLMIQIGDSSSGPFVAIVRTLQNVITTFRNWGTALLQLIPVYMVFRNRINGFFNSMVAGAKAWAKQDTIAKEIVIAEAKKTEIELKMANAQITASEKKRLAEQLATQRQVIAGYRAQQRAAAALKATLSTLGWTVAIIGVELLISKIVAMNAAMRNANKSIEENEKQQQNLLSKTNLLISMIGDGSDKNSLNGAVNEACRMFSEFSTVIQQAYVEAGKTGNYTKLKNVLQDIANLQTKIMASKSVQELVDATREVYVKSIRTRDDDVSKQIRKTLRNQGFETKQIDNVYDSIADIIIRNNDSVSNSVSELKNFLATFSIKIDNESLKQWVKEVTPKTATGFWGNRKDSSYTQAVNAFKKQQNLLTDIDKRQTDITWNAAIDRFNSQAKEAEKNYKIGSREYSEAMAYAANELKSAVSEIVEGLSEERKKEYSSILDKWGTKKPDFVPDATSGGSTKKTEQDRFNDIVDDYVKDTVKLQKQYENGIITTNEYQKAIADLKVETVKTIAGVDDLSSKLSALPSNLSNAGTELEAMVSKFNELQVEQILDEFRSKADEINTRFNNSNGDDTALRTFNEDFDELYTQTLNQLNAVKDVTAIVKNLTPELQELFRNIVTANNDIKARQKSEQLKELEKDTTIKIKEPKTKVLLSPDDNSVEGLKQKLQRMLDKENFEINFTIDNDSLTLDEVNDRIKQTSSAIEGLEGKIDSNDTSIELVKDEAIEKLKNLKNYLQTLVTYAATLEDKIEISNIIVQINERIEELNKSAIDNISDLSSAFDKLMDSVKTIGEAFGAEMNMEGLEKAMSVVNAVIQSIEALKTIVETFQAIQQASQARQMAANAALAASNVQVATSEAAKAAATGQSSVMTVADTTATTASTSANQALSSSNLNVASTEMAKAAATGASATASGANSVAKIPYVGAALAVAAAASISAALIAAFSRLKGFANGGIVGGNSFSGDRNLIRANSGEMILTQGQQRTLFNMIKTGKTGGSGGDVEFHIKGADLVGVLSNYNRLRK